MTTTLPITGRTTTTQYGLAGEAVRVWREYSHPSGLAPAIGSTGHYEVKRVLRSNGDLVGSTAACIVTGKIVEIGDHWTHPVSSQSGYYVLVEILRPESLVDVEIC